MRGRKPTPTELLEKRGTLEAHRHNFNAPKPDKLKTVPPIPVEFEELFTPEMKQDWYNTSETLLSMNIFRFPDLDALCSYIVAKRTWIEANKDVLKNGGTIEVVTSAGVTYKRNPATAVASSAYAVMKDFWARFGFTPADRQRIEADATGNEQKGEFNI